MLILLAFLARLVSQTQVLYVFVRTSCWSGRVPSVVTMFLLFFDAFMLDFSCQA